MTQLDGLRVVTLGETTVTRDILMFGENPHWSKNLHVWGEAGIVKERKNGKTGDRGVLMMVIGYPLNRKSDSVRMWNPATNGIVTTRDVAWLKRMFFEPEPSIGFELDPARCRKMQPMIFKSIMSPVKTTMMQIGIAELNS